MDGVTKMPAQHKGTSDVCSDHSDATLRDPLSASPLTLAQVSSRVCCSHPEELPGLPGKRALQTEIEGALCSTKPPHFDNSHFSMS